MKGVLEVFLRIIELDHISVVPASLWHLCVVLRVLLHCSVEISMVPWLVMVPHGPPLAVTKYSMGEVSHLLHTQVLFQGEAHLVLESALLPSAETAPGHGNSQLSSRGFTQATRGFTLAIKGVQRGWKQKFVLLLFPCLQGFASTIGSLQRVALSQKTTVPLCFQDRSPLVPLSHCHLLAQIR